MNYYNDNDQFVCDWLENLIEARLLPPGHVDRRSITDIEPGDLAGYTQCHFFCGIGGWPLALALAGWPADRPAWTGSCPCQPLSGAGKRKGHADERHLWPAFHGLIAECRPPVVFGEQVASADGREWLAAVRLDMEALGYACGAADLCAAGVGAPHIRQRLWWVGHSSWAAGERNAGEIFRAKAQEHGTRFAVDGCRPVGPEHASASMGRLADADGGDAGTEGLQRGRQQRQQSQDGGLGRLADAGCHKPRGQAGNDPQETGFPQEECQPKQCADVSRGHSPDDDRRRDNRGDGTSGIIGRPGPPDGFWSNADWLYCTDGRWRPVEPGTSPLASRIPGRVGQLRAYGNAIVPQVAAEFIAAYMDATHNI